jgi:hypothetical protein
MLPRVSTMASRHNKPSSPVSSMLVGGASVETERAETIMFAGHDPCPLLALAAYPIKLSLGGR